MLSTVLVCVDPDSGNLVDGPVTKSPSAQHNGEIAFASVCLYDRLHLQCGENAVISHVAARFGRDKNDNVRCIVGTTPSATTCRDSRDVSAVLGPLCVGQSQCSVVIKPVVFSALVNCPGAYLLEGTFTCSEVQPDHRK